MDPGFCAECFRGTLRDEAQPTGTEETIHGLQTYVARPDPGSQAEPLGLVVIITDIFGWELPNTRALADAYARRGPFEVYVPDFMDGNCPPPASFIGIYDQLKAPSTSWWTKLVVKPWLALKLARLAVPLLISIRHSVVGPRINAFFEAVRLSSAAPGGKVGVVGFCWGGRYAIDLCGSSGGGGGEQQQQQPLVDCGFTAHPSNVKIPEALHRVRAPLSVANGPDDEWMGRDNMEVLTSVLEGVDGGKRHEVVIYDGAKHGFAVRGNPLDPRQAELGLQAEDQAVSWFRRQFSS